MSVHALPATDTRAARITIAICLMAFDRFVYSSPLFAGVENYPHLNSFMMLVEKLVDLDVRPQRRAHRVATVVHLAWSEETHAALTPAQHF